MAIKRIKHLIVNLLRGSSSVAERAEMAKWMSSEEAERDSKEAWESASEEIDSSLKNKIWDDIRLKINDAHSRPTSTRHIGRHRIYSITKVAAFIAVILCSTFAARYLYDNILGYDANAADNRYTFEVESGQKGSIQLADGTVVYLNAASKISYAGNYNSKNRVVKLDGEAYFKVAKNPDKKFIVTCNGVDIEALGTEFNVKAYSTDSLITTTLAKGKVKVSNKEHSVTLLPLGVATYNMKQQTIIKSTIDNIAIADFWRSGQLVFESVPLSSIAQTIERMYNVKVYIKDVKLKNMKFTGTIRNNSLNNVLEVISQSYPIMYTTNDSVITISAQKNNININKTKM
ncbi:FecR family protein [Bacteroides sedimenti]|uniref:Iron dicitrate transporter FecR n=1 Tax=Bacteroides sedimenti TaxID=2136147 RepID=A0ABM8I8K7_9BACE